jgi:uncharacterized integral membrane protein
MQAQEESFMTDYESAAAAPRERPNLWIGPTIFVAVLLTLVLILIFSNTESTNVEFAGFTLTDSAPRWLVLAITFAAGAVVAPISGWAWRTFRKRRRRIRAELEGVPPQAEPEED